MDQIKSNSFSVPERSMQTRIQELEQQVKNAEVRAITAEEFLGRAVEDLDR